MTNAPVAARVAVLVPMRPELRPVVEAMGLARDGTAPGVHSGRVGAVEVRASLTGIGPALAAKATERVLRSAPVARVVVVGIAGGLAPHLTIGDLFVPEVAEAHDSGGSHRAAPLPGLERSGTVVTTTGLVTDPDEIARLRARGVGALDMESAAVAAVCDDAGVPWSVVRAISDRVGDAAIDDALFGLSRPDGGADPAAVARFVLTRPHRIPGLARLGAQMRTAARAAAAAAARSIAQL